MPDAHGFGETLSTYTGHAAHHFDLLVVACFYAGKDQVGRVDNPAPGCAHGVGAVPPAEDAFVGAGEGGCGFHALVGSDAVEGEFITGASATESGFGPAANFDARVRADNGVALLCERIVGRRVLGDHFFDSCWWRGSSFLGVSCEIYLQRFRGIN